MISGNGQVFRAEETRLDIKEFSSPRPPQNMVVEENHLSAAASSRDQVTGYLHPRYAGSLAEFGMPLPLPESGGHLLARQIPGTEWQDAMGCYPLFCCQHWTRLPEDIEDLRDGMVSVALVADPMGNYDEPLLRRCFDHLVKFKEHFVADLSQPLESHSSATHRKFARRAQRRMSIEVCANPVDYLDAWTELYGHLVRRHHLSEIKAFSKDAFAQQLAVPGMVMFRASEGDETIGMDLWYLQGDTAQGHLAAMNERGYELQAAYGLKLAVIEYFTGKARWLNLGGGAGLDVAATDGLTAFKRGWAGQTRTAWFCGRILQPERYQEILRQRNLNPGGYFPAYRAGEFN
jgi:hypothetical protein